MKVPLKGMLELVIPPPHTPINLCCEYSFMVPAWAPQWIGWFGVLCLCSIVNVSRNKGPPVTSFVLFAAMNPPQDTGKIPE